VTVRSTADDSGQIDELARILALYNLPLPPRCIKTSDLPKEQRPQIHAIDAKTLSYIQLLFFSTTVDGLQYDNRETRADAAYNGCW
jgi:hypothetical protein